ncbi:hypothetical protein C8F04DRAFT_1278634 [Mycena alexandri]|uniref:Uncharacterized protein n=1 Tax=Mycena alexandri TaxID=1745969 RepID=A0AAD6WNI2_9AGAR|nr:hypothetical protein C8F04DRAFT_1278634 [Mycena alexandri]
MSLPNAQQIAAVARAWLESKPSSHFAHPSLTLNIPSSGDPRGLATPIAIKHVTESVLSDIEDVIDLPPSFSASVFAVRSHDLRDETQLGDWLNHLFGELVVVITEEAKKIPGCTSTARHDEAFQASGGK